MDEMKVYGLTTIDAILGDMIVYRNLEPMETRLLGLHAIAPSLGIAPHATPRKSEPNYARVMTHLLHSARALEAPRATLRRLIFVGDTRMNDGLAFRNLCGAGGWAGAAFIGSENRKPDEQELVNADGLTTMVANRWHMLFDFAAHLDAVGFAVDENTVVVLDLDKTTLGARGRNDHVIDTARLAAVRETIATLLGADFDIGQFETSYALLNQPEFHPFTSDNQDYLTYLCLILGSGAASLDTMVREIRDGTLTRFADYLQRIDGIKGALSPNLRDLHGDIYTRVAAGDPTPFKAFRYNEYRATVSRMGHMPGDATIDALLAQEILITQEVLQVATHWRDLGALIFGLSDKPDEASVPSTVLAEQGYKPLHQTPTHAVGTDCVG